MAEHILKSHNKTLLLYHLVFPAKYRRKVFSEEVEKTLKEVCLEMGAGYEIHFLEIGTDEDHAHFLVQSVPTMSVTRIVTVIKSITGREIRKRNPEVKIMLWGGKFWTSGYYANTVGQYANEQMIRNYVKNQGKKYKQVHRDQLIMFEGIA
jgi:putative transposase